MEIHVAEPPVPEPSPFKDGIAIAKLRKCKLPDIDQIKFSLYKAIFVHELKQPDYRAKINFCNWLQQNVQDRVKDPQLLFIGHCQYT
jgi:hypothetical protein